MTPIDRSGHRAPRRIMTVRTRLIVVASVAITALLVLVVVNAVPAWDKQRNLRNDSTTGRLGGEASLPLFIAAQTERKLTAAYLAHPSSAAKAALQGQREKTDAGLASFRRLSGTELRTDQRHRWEYVEAVYQQLDGLSRVRKNVDAREGEPDESTGYYTSLINKMISFYQALSAMDDGPLTLETRPLVGLFYASDALAQQDMLITQARESGQMTDAHRVGFAEAYGTQQVMYERWIAPYLPEQEKALYDKVTGSPEWKELQAAQRSVITPPTDELGKEQIGDRASLAQWDDAYGKVSGQLAGLNLQRTQGLLAHGFQRADEIRTQVFLQAAGSLAAILLIAGLIIWLIRSISARLRQLRQQTQEGAERLPQVVDRLMRGEVVDARAEFPDPDRGDEFSDVQAALVEAQRTAVRQAADQAADRRGIGAFVAAATERTLGHINRALGHLERVMARPDVDPALLDDLITIDGAVSASRRHQEHVGTLAGSMRQDLYDRPRSLLDLVNDAAVETGSPKRVTNEVTDTAYVPPQHAAATVKVVAALLENGIGNSTGDVTVRSVKAVHGFALEIEDTGFGMPQEAIDAANAELAQHNQATFEAMAQRKGHLGLFVVARLAGRHYLSVSLRRSAYSGITAVVMIDNKALTTMTQDVVTPPTSARPQPTALTATATGGAPSHGSLPRRRQPVLDPAAAHAQRRAQHLGAGTLPAVTDADAAALPRRSAGQHLNPILRGGARAPQQPGARAESDPQQVGTDWADFQSGTQQATEYDPHR
ncbi:nitrate- and nitrite sensing domain-containing protein [Streptomyces sp. NPDC086796]|uniref:nitrate- and nitrite sensing domain-containing protein n=1 Tax=Streptomyces sp. NPDC086796 TaxID=3365760 RepID=UPI0037F92C95